MTLGFFPTDRIASWSRLGIRHQSIGRPRFVSDLSAWSGGQAGPRLAIGSRRSYSDVGLADGGRLVDMTGLQRFRSFDADTGVLVAEAGVTLDSILTTFVPRGFFVPVTPGTRFVTLGGAVANDVHGKNHGCAGTFGCHVRSLVLERSDEGRIRVSPDEHGDLFAATIGGLGLTGVILEVELQLQRIPSAFLDTETIACRNLDQLCDLLEASEADYEHSVAWIDCTATGAALGRGILSRANWSNQGDFRVHRTPRKSVPSDRMDGLLNPVTLKIFNTVYYGLGRMTAGRAIRHYEPLFYPLDAILNWNRLYGRAGLYQYQCVIPRDAGRRPVARLLERIAASGEGSFLAVLKSFGNVASPGMLSFPRQGLTLALDFRNRGNRTLDLLRDLDAFVEEAAGRLYPAKDIRIPRKMFESGYPALGRFATHVDPNCCSDFWKRMSQ